MTVHSRYIPMRWWLGVSICCCCWLGQELFVEDDEDDYFTIQLDAKPQRSPRLRLQCRVAAGMIMPTYAIAQRPIVDLTTAAALPLIVKTSKKATSSLRGLWLSKCVELRTVHRTFIVLFTSCQRLLPINPCPLLIPLSLSVPTVWITLLFDLLHIATA